MKYLVLITLLLFAGTVSAQLFPQYEPLILPDEGTFHCEVGTTITGSDYQFTIYERGWNGEFHYAYSDPAVWLTTRPNNVIAQGPSKGDYVAMYGPPSSASDPNSWESGGIGGVPQPGSEGTYEFEITFYWYDAVSPTVSSQTYSFTQNYTVIVHSAGSAPMLGWESGSGGGSSSGNGGGNGGDDESSGCAGTLGDFWALIPVLILLVIAFVFTIASRYIGGQDDGEDDEEGSGTIRLREYRSQAPPPTQKEKEVEAEKEKRAQLQG